MKAQRIRVLVGIMIKVLTTAIFVPLLGLVQQSSFRTTHHSVRINGHPFKGTSHVALGLSSSLEEFFYQRLGYIK